LTVLGEEKSSVRPSRRRPPEPAFKPRKPFEIIDLRCLLTRLSP
jgi:hypothetical protein